MKKLSNTALRLVARRFKALSEPIRLQLVMSVMEGEKSVSELVELSGAHQANVSRHLHTLADAGLLKRRKEGLHVFYSIAGSTLFDLCDLVCGGVEDYLKTQVDAFG